MDNRSNRRNAASSELNRFIHQLQKEYFLSSIEIVSLLSSLVGEISEKLLDEANVSKVPVQNVSIENIVMKEIKQLEKLGRKE